MGRQATAGESPLWGSPDPGSALISRINPGTTCTQLAKLLQNWAMEQPSSISSSTSIGLGSSGLGSTGPAASTAEGPYRVRPQIAREQSVPQQVTTAPRFNSRDDAETFAHLMARNGQQAVVVEKLAPAGCWLQLSTVAA
jgi:hypothetical protein